MMTTRAVLQMRKSPLINALRQASFSSGNISNLKHGQLASLGSQGSTPTFTPPSATSVLRRELSTFSLAIEKLGLLNRNLSCGPAFRSVITRPNYGLPSAVPWQSHSLRFNTSGKFANISQRFGKQRRNRGEMKGTSDNSICFGSYGLQVLEPAWITAKQILAGQLAIKRNMRGGKLLLRIFPHKPISLRPAETRMGRGKGNVAYWVAGVRAGRIIYEINGVPESVARRAITVAASKFPVQTRFVKSQ